MKSSQKIPGTGWSDKPDALDRARNFIEDDAAETIRKESEALGGGPDARRKLSRDRLSHDARRSRTRRRLLDQIEQLGHRFDKGDRLRTDQPSKDNDDPDDTMNRGRRLVERIDPHAAPGMPLTAAEESIALGGMRVTTPLRLR